MPGNDRALRAVATGRGRSRASSRPTTGGSRRCCPPRLTYRARFADLLSNEAVDELVSERGLRTPFLRVAKSGSTLAEKAFTAPGGVGAGVADQVSDDKLVRLFADGSTMVLQGLHRIWPPIIALCQQLAAELGHPGPGERLRHSAAEPGLQQSLRRARRLRAADRGREALADPPAGATRHRCAISRGAIAGRRSSAGPSEPPLIEAVLRPGDCLYLPRGFLHAATALGTVSTHLTIGVHPWTRFTLAEQVLCRGPADGGAGSAVARLPAARSRSRRPDGTAGRDRPDPGRAGRGRAAAGP